MKLKLYIAAMMAAFTISTVRGQEVAVKTNLLYDAFLNINAGIEMGLAPRWTFDISGDYNNWNMSHHRKWKHWMLQPELRYWFCDRFGGHFLALHAHGGQYNVGGLKNDWKFLGTDFSKLSNARYQGWFVGGGLGYGYAWQFSKHWGMEAEIGVGYSYTRFDRFRCAGCQKKNGEDLEHHYIGVTKAAVNLIYGF